MTRLTIGGLDHRVESQGLDPAYTLDVGLANVLGVSPLTEGAALRTRTAPGQAEVATGTLPGLNAELRIPCDGAQTIGVQITGTFTATATFEATVNGADWVACAATSAAGGAVVTTATAAGLWAIPAAGYAAVRVRCSAYTSGSLTTTLRADPGIRW